MNRLAFLDTLEERLVLWTKKRRYSRGRYGRFRFAKSAKRPSLSASLIALLDIYDYFGLMPKLSENQRRQWAQYLQGFQDPDSKLFVDRQNRQGIIGVQWSEVEEYDTARSLDALALLGDEALLSVRQSLNQEFIARLQSSETMIQWLESFDWYQHPWGAATAVQQVMQIVRKTMLPGVSKNKVSEAVRQYLLDIQDSTTALWGGDQDNPEELASATYKVFIIFGEFGWPVPRRRNIAQWAHEYLLEGGEPQHLCALRNRVCLVLESWLDREDHPYCMVSPRTFWQGITESLAGGRLSNGITQSRIQRLQEAITEILETFRTKDNGYAFHKTGRSTSHHNGVILCKGNREGDFLAASNVAFCHVCLRSLELVKSQYV
jgi:hypothetical protein